MPCGDPNERIFNSYNLGTIDGTKSHTFTAPEASGDNLVHGTTYARFRLSTTGGLLPTGAADDGEVEDYQVTVYANFDGALFVDDDSTAAEPDGTSWASAFPDLETALTLARSVNVDHDSNGDFTEIRVAGGVYVPTALSDADLDGTVDTDPRSATFSLVGGTSLYGGYAGLMPQAPDTPDTRDTTTYVTALSGDLDGDDTPEIPVAELLIHATRDDNAYSVVTAADTTLALNGLTITGGNANVTSNVLVNPNRSGGGIFSHDGANVSLVDVSVSGNSAGYGGGIYGSDDTLTVTNSTIGGNAAEDKGGGIYSRWGATLRLTNSAISGNLAAYGGGIYSSQGTLAVTNSSISGNAAARFGGGIDSSSSTLTVTNSTISGNSASDEGGGIYSFDSTLTVTNSTIAGNSASDEGGGIYSSGTIDIANSTITGNSADERGGGIHANGTVTVSNSTIAGNSAAVSGGGIYSAFSTVTFTNSTISGNSASRFGGGIYSHSFSSYTGTLTVSNSTISGNSAGSRGGGIYGSRGTLTVINSTIAGNSAVDDGGGIWSNYGTFDATLNNTMVALNTASNWPDIEGPVTGSHTLIGDGGSDHVTIIWADNTIENQWLQVTVVANADTGLVQNDVFYAGNRIGEANGSFQVLISDMYAVYLGLAEGTAVDDPLDFDRNGAVRISDMYAAYFQLSGPALYALTAPAALLQSIDSVFDENPSWAIELMWLDELYGTSSDSEEEEDDPLEATAADGVSAVYYEE